MHDKNELLKHTAAVHIVNTLTLTQRKAANILLKQAWPTLNQDKTHKILISDIGELLGWGNKSNVNEMLKEALQTLNKTQVEWNIFGKDKKSRWGIATILSGIEIEGGVLYYRYDKGLRDLLSSPTIYAKLNLVVQQSFRSKHALALWEFLVEALCSAQVDSIQTPWIELDKFRRMFSVMDAYYDDFSKLNQKVIKPAIAEINKVSDISCSIEYKKEGRKVSAISFSIVRKNNYQLTLPSLPFFNSDEVENNKDNANDIINTLVDEFKLSLRTANSLIKKYKFDEINDTLEYVRIQRNNGTIKDIAKFTYSALKEGWKKEKSLVPTLAIEIPEETITDNDWRCVREILKETLGTPLFFSWIAKLELVYKTDSTVELRASTNFIKNWIDNNYKNSIDQAWKEQIPSLQNIIIRS